MACPEPLGSLESRFFAALEGAQSFSFLVGGLALTYRLEDRIGAMVFVPDSTSVEE
jgi:hypothetical protein